MLSINKIKPLFKTPEDGISVFLHNDNAEGLKIKFVFHIICRNKLKRCSITATDIFPGMYDKSALASNWGFREFLSMKKLTENSDFFLPEGCLTIKCDIQLFLSQENFQKLNNQTSGYDYFLNLLLYAYMY